MSRRLASPDRTVAGPPLFDVSPDRPDATIEHQQISKYMNSQFHVTVELLQRDSITPGLVGFRAQTVCM